MCHNYEDFGMIHQLADFIEENKIQLFVVDTVDRESWSPKDGSCMITEGGSTMTLMERTLGNILEDPAITEIAPDAISKWDLSKEEFYGWTLQEIADRMGWGCLERGFKRLFKAAEREYYFRLYSDEECAAAPEKKDRNLRSRAHV